MADNDQVKVGVDAAERVAGKAEEWCTEVSTARKIEYLRAMLKQLDYHSCHEWATLHARLVQKVPTDDQGQVDVQRFGHLLAEGFTAGPAMFANYLQILIAALEVTASSLTHTLSFYTFQCSNHISPSSMTVSPPVVFSFCTTITHLISTIGQFMDCPQNKFLLPL